ncbi:MAG: RimK family alpha-L-glutamate ligase [Candidatus Hermodarchaeota archaeon]
MIKIGLIIDKYHLEKKVDEFLRHLKTIAQVSIYLEESLLLDFSKLNFNENIFFVKGKGELILNLVKLIENETSIPVINSSKAIQLCFDRFLNSVLLKKTGIEVPDFSVNPIGVSPPFNDYIIKNVIDQKNYTFTPKIQSKNGHLQISDERALNEVIGGQQNYQFFYYQRFIKSKWEYKVYSIGENFYFYKQLPVLINPDKIKSREEINPILELKEIVIKIKEILDLKITSVDFLKSKNGKFYVSDVNSTPNFNYIKNGPEIVCNFLINQAKR